MVLKIWKTRKAEIRYLFAALATAGLFSQFVACGSQLYKVSMEGDHGDAPASRLAGENEKPGSKYYGIHAASGWNNLPIEVKFSDKFTAKQKKAFIRAQEIWQKAADKVLFKNVGLTHEDADGFSSMGDVISHNINGIYLRSENWAGLGKNSNVLATTNWFYRADDPNFISIGGKIYNGENYRFCDTLVFDEDCGNGSGAEPAADLTMVALHEWGHFLGLAHRLDDPLSIMAPALPVGRFAAARTLSVTDIKLIRQVFGTTATARKSPEQIALEIQQDENKTLAVQ